MNSKCNPSDCYNCKEYSYRELDDFLYSIHTTIAELGYADVLNKKYGYKIKPNFPFTKLKVLTSSLKRHINLVYNNAEVCLCPKEVQLLIEKIREVIDYVCEEGCRDDVVVFENTNAIISNPSCHSYEDWEKLLYKKCPQLTYVETAKQVCQLTFDELLTKKCELSILDTLEEKCNITLENESFVEKCKIEYQELAKQKCDFTFDDYLAARCYETTLVEQVKLCQDCENC